MEGVDTSTALDTVVTATGGGVVGVLGYWIYLFLSGRLRAQKEVDAALASKDAEINRLVEDGKTRDADLAKEREYSKQLVREMQDQNEAMRHEVFPSMTSILQHILAERAQRNGN